MITLDLLQLCVDYWLKPLLALGLVFAVLRRPNFRSAAANHLVLVFSLVLVVFVLMVLPVLPEWHWQILPAWFSRYGDMSIPVTRLEARTALLCAVVAIYILGVTWILFHTLLGVSEASKITQNSRQCVGGDLRLQHIAESLANVYTLKRIPTIVISRQLQSPLVWRWRNPVVVMPASYNSWTKGRIERVLAHEFAHIERNDWLVKMSIRLCCALIWFLPMVWLFSRKINWYAEVACDDRVLELLDCRGEYADDLLDLSTDIKHSAFALAYLRRSELYKRISLVLDPCREKCRPNSLFKWFACAALLALVLPIAAVRIEAHPTLDKIFDIAHYPLPTLVPLLEIPEELPWADNTARLQWLIHQQELINQHNRTQVKDTNRDKQLAEQLVLFFSHKAPIRPQRPVEETLSVAIPIHPQPLPISEAELDDRSEVALPEILIRGYLPLKMVMPTYPRLALKRKITGRVIVQFDVNEQGETLNARIVSAQPEKIFDKAVLHAIDEFRFLPLTVDGQPIITKNVTEAFVFTL